MGCVAVYVFGSHSIVGKDVSRTCGVHLDHASAVHALRGLSSTAAKKLLVGGGGEHIISRPHSDQFLCL